MIQNNPKSLHTGNKICEHANNKKQKRHTNKQDKEMKSLAIRIQIFHYTSFNRRETEATDRNKKQISLVVEVLLLSFSAVLSSSSTFWSLAKQLATKFTNHQTNRWLDLLFLEVLENAQLTTVACRKAGNKQDGVYKVLLEMARSLKFLQIC